MTIFDKHRPTKLPNDKPINKEISHTELYAIKMGTKYLKRYNDYTLDLSLTNWISQAYYFEEKKDIQKVIDDIGGEIITIEVKQV